MIEIEFLQAKPRVLSKYIPSQTPVHLNPHHLPPQRVSLKRCLHLLSTPPLLPLTPILLLSSVLSPQAPNPWTLPALVPLAFCRVVLDFSLLPDSPFYVAGLRKLPVPQMAWKWNLPGDVQVFPSTRVPQLCGGHHPIVQGGTRGSLDPRSLFSCAPSQRCTSSAAVLLL